MTDTRVQFLEEPHVMQPGSVAEYLRDFVSHLAAQGYQSLSISNYRKRPANLSITHN
jgi:hypothetical protein